MLFSYDNISTTMFYFAPEFSQIMRFFSIKTILTVDNLVLNASES